jgi:hypothetical protein
MRRRLLMAGTGAVTLALGGCGAIFNDIQKWENDGAFTVAAVALCEETPGLLYAADRSCKPTSQAVAPATALTPKQQIGWVLNESLTKCDAFVAGLVLTSNSANVDLDSATTVFSALGTAFTPLALVHGLTAAGSISSGWKTAIDSDIYGKSAIADYAKAIQTSYYTDLRTYMDAIKTESPTADDLPFEIATIRTIHKECSLASAQATIAANLASPATATAATAETNTVTVLPFAGTAQFGLVGTGGPLPAGGLTLPPQTLSGTPSTVAQQLVKSIAANSDFVNQGVTAALVSASSPSFTLKSPAGITWTQTGGKLEIAAGTAATTTTPSGAATAATGTSQTSAPAATRSVVPGHATAK